MSKDMCTVVDREAVVSGSASGRAPVSLIITVLGLALAVNAAIVLVALPSTGGSLDVVTHSNGTLDYGLGFGDLYDFIAKNLREGHGYRVEPYMGETILREPGYPILIAAIFKAFGYGSAGPRALCILMAFGAALLLLLLARKITSDWSISLASALLFLLYPGTLVAESRAGNEMPTVLMMALFILALHRAVERCSLKWYGVAGLLLGLTALVRSEVLMFPAFVLAYLLLTARSWRGRGWAVLQVIILGIGVTIAMSPWIVRNYVLVHKFVPTDTLGGVAAQEGLFTCEHLPEYSGFAEAQRAAGRERAQIAHQLGLRFEGEQYYQFFYSPQDEMKFNRALLDHVSTEYRANPGLFAGCAAKNLATNFWFLGKTPQATRLNMLVQLPVLACALVGIVLLYRLRALNKAAIILLYIVYIPLIHAPIIAHARHSMLVFAFLTIPVAVFLFWVWRTLRPRLFDGSAASAV
jgi:hypothetical protein